MVLKKILIGKAQTDKEIEKRIMTLVVIALNITLIIVVLYFAVILKDYIRIMDLNPCDVCFDKLMQGYYYVP